MHFLTRVFTDSENEDDFIKCVVIASSENQACFQARKYYKDVEGYKDIHFVDAQPFEQSEHGDYRDYELIAVR